LPTVGGHSPTKRCERRHAWRTTVVAKVAVHASAALKTDTGDPDVPTSSAGSTLFWLYPPYELNPFIPWEDCHAVACRDSSLSRPSSAT
jgi:hypothetical protein